MTEPLLQDQYREVFRRLPDGTGVAAAGNKRIYFDTVPPTDAATGVLTGATLKGDGATPPPLPDRSGLVPGTYKPDATNTGVYPGSTLALVTSAAYGANNSPDNPVVITNKRFRCRPSITGKHYRFENCEFEGNPLAGLELVTATNANAEGIEFVDCTFSPATVWSNMAYAKGHHMTFRRCLMEHCADGMAQQGPSVDFNLGPQYVKLIACYMRDFAYVSPDTGAAGGLPDNAGHVDMGMQMRGGNGNWIFGCNIQAFCTTQLGVGEMGVTPINMSNGWHITGNKYPNAANEPTAATSVFMYSPYLGDTADLVIESNWLDGGAVLFNFNPAMTSSTGIVIRNNILGPRGQRERWGAFILANIAQPLTVTGNVKESDGTPYNVRDRG